MAEETNETETGTQKAAPAEAAGNETAAGNTASSQAPADNAGEDTQKEPENEPRDKKISRLKGKIEEYKKENSDLKSRMSKQSSDLDTMKRLALQEKDEIEKLRKENADVKDSFLRSRAEFDNLKKRSAKEKQDAINYANENLLKDLLEVIDNFDRTIEASANATDPKTISDGIAMVSKSFMNMLVNKYGLAAFGNAGDAFDENLHEAVRSVEEDVASRVIKTVYLKGYKLKDRVIRYAKVEVSVPKSGQSAPETGEEPASSPAENGDGAMSDGETESK